MGEIEAVADLSQPLRYRSFQPAPPDIRAGQERPRDEADLHEAIDEKIAGDDHEKHRPGRPGDTMGARPDHKRHDRHHPGFENERPHRRVHRMPVERPHIRIPEKFGPDRRWPGNDIGRREADGIDRPQPDEPPGQKCEILSIPALGQGISRDDEKHHHRDLAWQKQKVVMRNVEGMIDGNQNRQGAAQSIERRDPPNAGLPGAVRAPFIAQAAPFP